MPASETSGFYERITMLFQRINRSDAETVFAIFYNVAGATITANYPAVWDISTSVDGVRVTQPAAATLSLIVGISTEDIADSAYGKFQVYGYRASAYVTNDDSYTIDSGDILIPVDSQWYLDLSSSGESDGKSGFIYAAQSFAINTTPAAANKKVLIRCL
jgi:hypothetical protein